MPFLELQTQSPLPEAEALHALLARLSSLVAGGLNKSESIVMVSITQSAAMHFASDTAPCCYVSLRGIGELNSATMNSVCQAVSEELERSLSIPSSRVFMVFDEVRRSHWAVRGRMLE